MKPIRLHLIRGISFTARKLDWIGLHLSRKRHVILCIASGYIIRDLRRVTNASGEFHVILRLDVLPFVHAHALGPTCAETSCNTCDAYLMEIYKTNGVSFGKIFRSELPETRSCL